MESRKNDDDWIYLRDASIYGKSRDTSRDMTGEVGRSPLLQRPNRYTEESTDSQDRILLPGETIIKTVDEKSPMKDILLPWNDTLRENSLLFYNEKYPESALWTS
jgi:hypothetical protein